MFKIGIIAKKYENLRLEIKHAIAGYIFISPLLIGLLVFFIYPIFRSILFSFHELQVSPNGYVLKYMGADNFRNAFLVDPDFRRVLTEAALQMIANVPMIIIFSFFAAVLINQNFRGKTLARAIFFLPVVLTSGVILALERNDMLLNIATEAFRQETVSGFAAGKLQALQLRALLLQSGLNPQFIGYITSAVDNIYNVVTSSGVQILVILAGLQTIPPSLYEAAVVEGCTGWEKFWKITFPMTTPLILVNVVYSIIDSFTKPTNQVMTMIRAKAFRHAAYGYSSALSWIYFTVIIIILAITTFIISRRVVYLDK